MKKILAIFILSLIAQQAQSSQSRNFLQPFKNFIGFVGRSFFVRNFHSFKPYKATTSAKPTIENQKKDFDAVLSETKSTYIADELVFVVESDGKIREITKEEKNRTINVLQTLENNQRLQKINNAPIENLVKRYYEENKANPNNGQFTIRPVNEQIIKKEYGRTFVPVDLQGLLAEAKKANTMSTTGHKLGGRNGFHHYLSIREDLMNEIEKQNKINEKDPKFWSFNKKQI